MVGGHDDSAEAIRATDGQMSGIDGQQLPIGHGLTQPGKPWVLHADRSFDTRRQEQPKSVTGPAGEDDVVRVDAHPSRQAQMIGNRPSGLRLP